VSNKLTRADASTTMAAAPPGQPAGAPPEPPVARRIASERTYHGDTVIDEYAWLADAQDPETLRYLEAENAYTAAMTAGQAGLRETIFGEIKGRTGRLYPFEDLNEVEATLDSLESAETPLVARLPRQPGRKESRYAHLLFGPVEVDETPRELRPDSSALKVRQENPRVTELETQVELLRTDIESLRQQFEEFKKQFE